MDLTYDKQQCRGQCFHLIPAKVILLCNFKSIHSFFEQWGISEHGEFFFTSFCITITFELSKLAIWLKPRDPNDPLVKHIAVKRKEVSISEKVEKFK